MSRRRPKPVHENRMNYGGMSLHTLELLDKCPGL